MRRGGKAIRRWLAILAVGITGLIALPTMAEVDREAYDVASIRLEEGPQISLIIIAQPRNREVRGTLVELDTGGITLDTRNGEATFAWGEVSPTSAFFAHLKLIDRTSSGDWLQLAAFARGVGAERQAEQSLAEAMKRDDSVADEVARIRRLPLGGLRESVLGSSTTPTTQPAASDLPDPGPVEEEPQQALAKYLPATEEQHAAAMERAKRAAHESGQRLGVTFRVVETQHFLIFTDWPASDDGYLAETLEEAYRLVAREFDMAWEENIFVGKLPVYMFAHHATFMRYAREIDDQKNLRNAVAGYYRSRTDGLGKLIMSTPQQAQEMGLTMARKVWARTLTHEFAHAFVARYRSNAMIPRWLNEGLAEMISEQVHPRPEAIEEVRRIARRNISVSALFDDDHLPPAEMYPVMMSLVQALYRENPQAFVTLIDRIKAGEEAESVLQELYGVDYRGLERAWRQHMMFN